MRRTLLILVTLSAMAGCTGQNAETRAREAEKKIKETIPDVVGAALEQKATPEQVKRAQDELKVLSEYLGEATGTLDAVTVSAIQAFQRTQISRCQLPSVLRRTLCRLFSLVSSVLGPFFDLSARFFPVCCLEADGILNEKTMRLLQDATANGQPIGS